MFWPRSVVCFGGEDWWYHNRGHCDIQFMRQLAQHGTVLYVNSIVMRKLNISEGVMFWHRLIRKSRSIARGLVQVSDSFWVYSPITAPVHHVPHLRSVNDRFLREQLQLTARRIGFDVPLVWANCPAACNVALSLPRTGLVYQRSDRYEQHPGVDVRQIAAYDRMLKQSADVTFFSNRKLHNDEAGQCRRALYVEHGVDYELFARADRDPWVPPEMRRLRRPVVGFFGGIDEHKFNVMLAAEVARKLPDFTFVFVGQASMDCSVLARQSHVVMIGQRPYGQIPHYGKCFDVCIMPFKQGRWIEGMSPIKLKEYLSLGKPVVSTPFPELAEFAGLVYVAADVCSFAAAIREALADDSAAAVRARRGRASGHSWQRKAVAVLRCVYGSHAEGSERDVPVPVREAAG